MQEIKINCDFFSNELLKQYILELFNSSSIIDKVPKFSNQLRGSESELIVFISSSGIALTALITGLIKLAISKKAQTIVIQGKDFKIIVPAGTSIEEIDMYIKKARESSIDKIIIRKNDYKGHKR
jgi:hypothetical protein